MSVDTLNIGAVPPEESCTQVGADSYTRLAKLECSLYREQLTEEINTEWPDIGCRIRLVIQSCAHDYGTYHEVEARYDPEDPIAVAQALYCEGEASGVWTASRQQVLEDFCAANGIDRHGHSIVR